MKVSLFNKFDMSNHYLQQVQKKANQQQIQIATGKQFQYLSQDPIKGNQSMLINDAKSRIEQFQKNIDDGNGFLSKADNTLGSSIDALQIARSEGLKAANGTSSERDRQTYAIAIDQSIEQLVALSNTKHYNRYLFSGDQTNTKPFEYDGNIATYNGNGDVPSINVSSNFNIKTSVSGDEAFQPSLDALINLREQVLNGTEVDMQVALGELDNAMDGMIDLRSEIGTRMQTLDMLDENFHTQYISLEEKTREVEDADLAKVVMEYATSQHLYQATIQSSAKMFDISLMNYI